MTAATKMPLVVEATCAVGAGHGLIPDAPRPSPAFGRIGGTELREMPHVIVQLWPGKSEAQKARLAEAIARNVMDILDYGEESVSVAMEEIPARDWAERVYRPAMQQDRATLYKKPGYEM